MLTCTLRQRRRPELPPGIRAHALGTVQASHFLQLLAYAVGVGCDLVGAGMQGISEVG